MTASADTPRPVSDPNAAAPIIFEAIVKGLCVIATYNRVEATIAPHIIYTRHGELYVDGVTIERDGKPPKELKLGAFKVAGLAGLRLTARRFTPNKALFLPSEFKYEGTTLMAVDLPR